MDERKHSIPSNVSFWVRYYLENEPRIFWIAVTGILLTPLFHMLALYFPKVTLLLVETGVSPEIGRAHV